MNKIIFPQQPGEQGPVVADLQDALHALLVRTLILPDDRDKRLEFMGNLLQDRVDSLYSEFTHQVVSIFQEEQGLEPHGSADEKTASALNALLNELGLLDETAAPQAFVVSGQVRRENGLPLPNTTVRAFHVASQAVIRLGEDSTNAEGRYTIRYEPLPNGAAVNLRVSAIGDNMTMRAIKDNYHPYS